MQTATVTSEIVVSGENYPQEVGWTLTCDDGTTLSGGNPYSATATIALAVACTLDMTDVFGDGWGCDAYCPGND